MGGGSPRARTRHSLHAPSAHPVTSVDTPRTPLPLPQFIPPPFQGGGFRWGVESRERASDSRCTPRSSTQSPAQMHRAPPYPFPNSSLPPSRGEVRWGVEARERAQGSRCTPRSPTQSPAQIRRAPPYPFPNSSLPPSSRLSRNLGCGGVGGRWRAGGGAAGRSPCWDGAGMGSAEAELGARGGLFRPFGGRRAGGGRG